MTRRGKEAALTVLLAAAIVGVGGGILYFVSTISVHPDPAAVPVHGGPPVQRYVPAYPEKQWTVTTRQLMGEVAGVHRIRGDNNDAMPGRHCASLDEALALFAGEPLQFSARDRVPLLDLRLDPRQLGGRGLRC
jgi:hypothetical protein